MRLILRIFSPTPQAQDVSHTFTEEGGTIGRARDNSWALTHEKVSSRHALISFREGVFYIQDTSRNGVSLNAPDNRLVPERPHALKPGDVIFIEPYEIDVSVETKPERQAIPLPHGLFSEDHPSARPPSVDLVDTMPQTAAPSSVPRSATTAVPASPLPRPGAGSIDLANFLAGAGLPPAQVTPELARELGEILRVVVAGLLDILQSRQRIKHEFRMRSTESNQTTNNPLKFSANVEDALYNLLVKRNAAYLAAVDAFADAFDDLRDDQLATLTGMRVAFEAMRGQFNPDRMGLEMKMDREAAFARVFEEEFARAYELQFQELRAQRRARGREVPRAPGAPIHAGHDPLSADTIAPPKSDTHILSDDRPPMPTGSDPLSEAFRLPRQQANVVADATAAALEQRMERARAALEAARQQLQVGSFDRAIRALEQARGLDPTLNTEIEAELLRARETAAKRALPAPETALTKAKTQDPTDAAESAREAQEHNDHERRTVAIDRGDQLGIERPTSRELDGFGGSLKKGVAGVAAGVTAAVAGVVAGALGFLWRKKDCTEEGETVKCSVFAPAIVKRGAGVLIQVFAHVPGHAAQVRTLAEAFDNRASGRAAKLLDRQLQRGSALSFSLSIPGIPIADSTQSLVWRGQPDAVQFVAHVPPNHPEGSLIGTVVVSQDTVPFGHLKFILEVVAHETSGRDQRSAAAHPWKRYRHAFISYASQDRAEVLKRVQMLDRTGIHYFQDLLSLDPGQRWERTLYRKIDESDVFFLFWSTAAKNSTWVMKEVRYAMERHGGDDLAPPEIVPVIIEGPPPVAPPSDLRGLHFNDQFLYFIAGSVGQP